MGFTDLVDRIGNRYIRIIQNSVVKEFLGEFFGTWLLVLIGTGQVASVVITGGRPSSQFSIAVAWFIGVVLCTFPCPASSGAPTLDRIGPLPDFLTFKLLDVATAIFCVGSLSGAHLNPAMSISFAFLRNSQFPFKKLLWFLPAQFLGGFVAAVMVLLVFNPAIAAYEHSHGIQRGQPGSHISARMFGEYFPDPASGLPVDVITPWGACLIEIMGAGILSFVVFAVTDRRNPNLRQITPILSPFLIGLTLAMLISVLGPLTQAGFNPARDLGPRIVGALFGGWGREALPGPREGLWVYSAGPFIGAPFGAILYSLIVGSQFSGKKYGSASGDHADESRTATSERIARNASVFQPLATPTRRRAIADDLEIETNIIGGSRKGREELKSLLDFEGETDTEDNHPHGITLLDSSS